MSISPRLEKYLQESGVAYEVMQHPAAYTASEIAGAQHIPGKEMIKAVIIKSGDTFVMCVLSAIHLIDFEKLETSAGLKGLELASEGEVSRLFPDYEKGAEPPFGHLYQLKMYIDSQVAQNDWVVFNAGTHTDVVKMRAQDFIDLSKGIAADFGRHI